jgi:oxygen-dependent protoporphyrinogen oxidase
MNFVRNATTVATEPLFGAFKTLFTLLKEPLLASRSSSILDESVGSFVSRRFGSALADNIVSAGFHGIYAGDVYQLSSRALLPLAYAMELKRNRVIFSLLDLASGGRIMDRRDYDLLKNSTQFDLPDMAGTSVYTLKEGLGQIVKALVQYLRDAGNVTIVTNASIGHLKFESGTGRVEVSSSRSSRNFDFSDLDRLPLTKLMEQRPHFDLITSSLP